MWFAVATDRAQGHSQYWLDDFSSIYKTIPEGIATHVYTSFHGSITQKGKAFYLLDVLAICSV